MNQVQSDSSALPVATGVELQLRVPGNLFRTVREHVEDFSQGEQAGFLICSQSSLAGDPLLLARRWISVPTEEMQRDKKGFMLAWASGFNARILEEADRLDGCAVLVHSHDDSTKPQLSRADESNGDELFSAMSRLLPDRLHGSVVLGGKAASGLFWSNGALAGKLSCIRVVGSRLEWWGTHQQPSRLPRRSLDRQSRAIGQESDGLLAASTVAVIGLSGGGSHVVQQLAHQGVGNLIGIDDQLVEDVQLGRMVGARASDVDVNYKTSVMRRLAEGINPQVTFEEIRERFPASVVREALLDADLVIACVDSFLAREEINAFCRRYYLPLIDIGMNIKTNDEGQLVSASGQVVVVLPDSACLRCGPLLSDAVLDWERKERPAGYDLNPDAAGDPQVVSMNGVLASEAANSALDLITGYSGGARGAAWWLYDGRRGTLDRCGQPSRRPSCPACAEQGHGDGPGS